MGKGLNHGLTVTQSVTFVKPCQIRWAIVWEPLNLRPNLRISDILFVFFGFLFWNQISNRSKGKFLESIRNVWSRCHGFCGFLVERERSHTQTWGRFACVWRGSEKGKNRKIAVISLFSLEIYFNHRILTVVEGLNRRSPCNCGPLFSKADWNMVPGIYPEFALLCPWCPGSQTCTIRIKR